MATVRFLNGTVTSPEPVEDIEESIQIYLQRISNTVPDSTYLSQQTHLSAFRAWYANKSITPDILDDDLVVQFVQHRLSEHKIAVPTARDCVSSLANLLAYRYQQDPEIVRIHLAALLGESPDSDLSSLSKQLGYLKIENKQTVHIDTILTFLRQRRFGKRIHAYVELLLDTKSRPEQVRQINLTDLDLQGRQVTIGIPDTHIVSTAGLVTQRVTDLSETTTDALETYLNHNRQEATENGHKPAFTTSRGRASSSTLRRAVESVSEAAFRSSSLQRKPDGKLEEYSKSINQAQTINPSEIWRSALSKPFDQT